MQMVMRTKSSKLSTSKYTKNNKRKMLLPVQHQYWDTNQFSKEQVSPTEPFTEVHLSPHQTARFTLAKTFQKNKERWLKRLHIFGHSSSVGSEKPEGQTPFFPEVGHSLLHVFVTFSSQWQYITRLFWQNYTLRFAHGDPTHSGIKTVFLTEADCSSLVYFSSTDIHLQV